MTFLVAMACFAYAGITIFSYTKSSFSLLEDVQATAPELWESLGQPEKIWVRHGNGGGMHTIQPIWPWLDWVWHCRAYGVDRKLSNGLKRTSQLLKRGLVAFVVTIITFFYAIVISPPA